MLSVLTFLAVIAVLAVLLAAGVLLTQEGDVLRDAPADGPDLGLPLGQLQPEDVPQLRFGMALRGYRMDEVDTTLARVRLELAARDRQIAELQQALEDAAASAQVAEDERTPEVVEQPWPASEWPETTSAVAETPEQVHAPVAQPEDDLFPEIAPPEPDEPIASAQVEPVSSFGLYSWTYEAPLGPPGVGFASSSGAPAEPV
jgi:DivIVA domain-containing protein